MTAYYNDLDYRGLHEEIPTCVGSASTTALIDTLRPFLVSPNHRQIRAIGTDDAYPTQTASARPALVTPPGAYIVEEKNHHTGRSVDDPLGTVIAGGNHHYLATPPPFLIGQQSGAVARPVTEESPTVAAGGAISLVVPVGGSWAERATDAHREAQPTQTAHETYGLAEAPHMLVPYHEANPAHAVSETVRTVSTHEHEALCSVEVAVDDCRFRMLQTHEIRRAMAFPDTYALTGNKREQIKLLGNAVTPPVMTLLLQRCLATLGGGG